MDALGLSELRDNPRHGITQLLNFAAIIVSALMIWRSLMILTACESPVIVGKALKEYLLFSFLFFS
jgi:hypothetical protein